MDQDDMDLKALGFDIAEGINDPYIPGDCGIFVTRVDKGSIADGRLRYLLTCLNDIQQQTAGFHPTLKPHFDHLN